jgi:hypothetical protein
MSRSRVLRFVLLLAGIGMVRLEAQDDAARAFPHNYKVILDNPDVTVRKLTAPPSFRWMQTVETAGWL